MNDRRPQHRVILSLASVLLVSLFVQGCQTVGTVRTAIDAERGVGDPVIIMPLDYAQAVVRIDEGAPGRMLLARVESGVQQWMAADGLTLWMRDGRIIATRGLRDDLLNLKHLSAPLSLRDFLRSGQPDAGGSLYAQLRDEPLGLVVETRLERVGSPSPVSVGGSVLFLQQVRETVRIAGTHTKWVNEYWIEEQGYSVLVTRQRPPGIPYDIRFERVR